MKEGHKIKMDNQSHEPEILVVISCFVIALFGGIARELSNFETVFSKRRFFSNIIVSGFAGLLVGLAAPEFEHKNIVMICAGISGTMGVSVLNYCGDLLKVILMHMAGHIAGHEITNEDLDNIKNKKED